MRASPAERVQTSPESVRRLIPKIIKTGGSSRVCFPLFSFFFSLFFFIARLIYEDTAAARAHHCPPPPTRRAYGVAVKIYVLSSFNASLAANARFGNLG